ncbi:hypothetical protein BKA93DRAFT_783952 [Sparassis latifolia]|uniref:Uncharacterized protein n=1 Tax=Sparassis crispa TaxID=139825 RepID=A0A401GS92_9APHY|nr:hypothetical protein SCP_0702730 [Sparassis crispa]GBE85087.1 hypothetical protein SCP_0702730 [Sparassis crispa]
MPTSLELAISSVISSQKSLSVPNVLAAYLHTTGFLPEPDLTHCGGAVAHEALVAFEHALDKQPAPPRSRVHAAEIDDVRKRYWLSRLGNEAPNRCTCPSCGKTVAYARAQLEDQKEQEASGEKPKQKTRDGRKKKKRVVKRRTGSSDSSSSYNPYGASSSTSVL